MDTVLFAVALWLAHFFRAGLEGRIEGLDSIRPFEDYTWLYLVILPFAPVVMEIQGVYQRSALQSFWSVLWRILRSSAILSVILIAVIFILRRQELVARSVIINFGVIGFGLIAAKESLLRVRHKGRFASQVIKRRFLLIGAPEDLPVIRADLKAQMPNEIDRLIELKVEEATEDRLMEILHGDSINSVILLAKHANFGQVEQLIQLCELEGVEVWLVADFFKTQISKTSLDDLFGRPVLVFRSTPEMSWEAVAKQLIDFVGAAVLLSFLAIPLLVVALAIKLTSSGPAFFRQQRSGLNGRPFTMYKFRSMVTNAEQLKHELAALNEMSGPVFKVTNDPRVTKIGRLLRKTSVDEFPQLINVLKGEMSLVGPRPLPVDEVTRFDDFAHRRRLSVKPGLTCLWQISGRNNVKDFKDWVRLDLEYIDNWSIWLDLKILWMTIPVVLFQKGAK
jgi:exopolysaccharide biosynthesis polyprenyl glycosylphosphotransferase